MWDKYTIYCGGASNLVGLVGWAMLIENSVVLGVVFFFIEAMGVALGQWFTLEKDMVGVCFFHFLPLFQG